MRTSTGPYERTRADIMSDNGSDTVSTKAVYDRSMASTTRRASAGADRRAVVEAQVLAATERLLAGGARFTELGVQRIVAEAGVARSSFYVHFRDKTELLLRLTSTLTSEAFALIGAAPPQRGSEGMVQAMREVVRYYRQRRHLLAAVLEVTAYDPVAGAAWEAELQSFI